MVERGSASVSPPSRRREVLLWTWALVASATLLLLWWLPSWTTIPPAWLEPQPLPEPAPDRLVLERSGFEELPGFDDDAVAEALPALRRSCLRFRFLGPGHELQPVAQGGTVADWLPFCDAVLELSAPDGGASREVEVGLRSVLREHLVPLAVHNNDRPVGLFTGYYEPTLQGSRRRTERFRYPLYARPDDIVSVDLGAFREDLAGRRLAGLLRGNRLEPYHDRSDIDAGALGRRGLELVWVDDPVDSFFLHIQGSGRVELEGGGTLRVGYAGQNGHPYYAIGRELVLREGMDPKDVSMQSIRAWLADNAEVADEVMQKNASYVFFRVLRGEGPLGSQGVALTPGRSLAVDRRHHPMGAPMWLDATAPAADEATERPLRRLMVAQDTGGAIRGPVRGDVFWGGGDEAAEVAGRMQHEGRLWILLPRTLAPDAPARRQTPDVE